MKFSSQTKGKAQAVGLVFALSFGFANSQPFVSAQTPKSNSLLLEANHFAVQNNYANAEADYLKFLTANPADANGHHMYGRVLAYIKRYEDALKQYKIALKLKPNDCMILTDVGVTLTVAGNAPLGARFLHQAFVSAPKSPYALNNLGAALMHLRDYAQAAQIFQRSLEIQPHNARIQELQTEATSKFAKSEKYDFGDNVSWVDIPDVLAKPPVEVAATDAKQQSEQSTSASEQKKKAGSQAFLEEKPLFVELVVTGFDSAEVSGLGYVQLGDNNEIADKVKEINFSDDLSVQLMGDVTVEFAGVGVVKFGKGSVHSKDRKSVFTINAGTGEINCLAGNLTVDKWNQVTAAHVYTQAQVHTNDCQKVYGMDDSSVDANSCSNVNLVGYATGVIEDCDEVILTDYARAVVTGCSKVHVLSNAHAKVSKCTNVICLENGKAEPQESEEGKTAQSEKQN